LTTSSPISPSPAATAATRPASLADRAVKLPIRPSGASTDTRTSPDGNPLIDGDSIAT